MGLYLSNHLNYLKWLKKVSIDFAKLPHSPRFLMQMPDRKKWWWMYSAARSVESFLRKLSLLWGLWHWRVVICRDSLLQLRASCLVPSVMPGKFLRFLGNRAWVTCAPAWVILKTCFVSGFPRVGVRHENSQQGQLPLGFKSATPFLSFLFIKCGYCSVGRVGLCLQESERLRGCSVLRACLN